MGAGLARLLVLGVDAVLLEPGDRLPVVEPQEGARGRGELGVERVDLGARLGVGEERVDDRADLDGQTSGEVLCHEKEGTHHLLDVVHQLVKGDEGELGLEVGVLGEMAAGVPAENSVSVLLKANENGN